MPETKKTWTEPELIVIARGKPEEAVLGGCKAFESSACPSNLGAGCAETSCSSCTVGSCS